MNVLIKPLLIFRGSEEYNKLIGAVAADDEAAIENTVNEMLRFVTPIRSFEREVTADHEAFGVEFKKGDRVTLLYGAANRDPKVFENPDVFDVTRPNASKQQSTSARW